MAWKLFVISSDGTMALEMELVPWKSLFVRRGSQVSRAISLPEKDQEFNGTTGIASGYGRTDDGFRRNDLVPSNFVKKTNLEILTQKH